MAEGCNQLSRNPNMCASCSSMADGMDDLGLLEPEPPAAPEPAPPPSAKTVPVTPGAALVGWTRR
jgi:hypothetical protein